MEQLAQLLTKLNPFKLLRSIVNILRPNRREARQKKDQAAAEQRQDRASGSLSSRQSTVSQTAKRKTSKPGKVHTVHDAEGSSESDDPDGNKYWNGNSTQFDGKDK